MKHCETCTCSGHETTADETDRLRAKNATLRGILDRLVSCDTSTKIGQIVTGKAAVEAAREYVANHRPQEPSAWLVKLDDGWRYLASTKEDAERTQREKGGSVIPMYEMSPEEPAAPRGCPAHSPYVIPGCEPCRHTEKASGEPYNAETGECASNLENVLPSAL